MAARSSYLALRHPQTQHRQEQAGAEVLFWVAQGKTNAEVGTILDLSSNTVRKHLERIYLRLGVENRVAAAHRALEVLGLPDA